MNRQKRVVVCGAGGFIGYHLTGFLKEKGYWVRGVDIKEPQFASSPVDEFLLLDLREPESCHRTVRVDDGRPTRSTSSPPTWAVWGSSTPPSARS